VTKTKPHPSVVTDSETLAVQIASVSSAPYIAIDTEFMRERTYFPILCLVQIAAGDIAFAIDPLAKDIDLTPLYNLLADPKVVKVFHSASQDIELFYYATGTTPKSVFDTQVAAEVLGYGESASYATLVKKICKVEVDKSSRFTDWMRRPLSDAQIEYALTDVTYLCDVYEKLSADLEKKERIHWIDEEMKKLLDPEEYENTPEDSWRRIKTRGGSQKFLRAVKAIAAWREEKAKLENVPRQRILRDEILLEVAAVDPKSIDDLKNMRRLANMNVGGRLGEVLIGLLAAARDSDEVIEIKKEPPIHPSPALVELLKVVLKAQCETNLVTQKLIARSDDIDKIAALDEEVLLQSDMKCMHGWRFEVFGKAALELKNGKLLVGAKKQKIMLIPTA
jgi:ribonuclease D